mgnify:CR=1 FL=1
MKLITHLQPPGPALYIAPLLNTVLLLLTFGVSLVTFGGGRTNILPGFVHLVLFAVFAFLVFVP